MERLSLRVRVLAVALLVCLASAHLSFGEQVDAPAAPLPPGLSKEGQFLIFYMEKRFDQMDKRFEELRKDMNRRFEQVDRRFDQMDKRFEQIDKRFEELREDMNKRFEQVDKRFGEVNQRFSELVTLMGWIVGGLFALVAVFVALLLWDRRTAVRAAVKESKEEIVTSMEREYELALVKKMLRAFREKARTDSELAEILRGLGLL